MPMDPLLDATLDRGARGGCPRRQDRPREKQQGVVLNWSGSLALFREGTRLDRGVFVDMCECGRARPMEPGLASVIVGFSKERIEKDKR